MNEGPRKDFPAHMIGHAHHGHDQENHSQHPGVDWHRKHQRGNEQAHDNRFNRVKIHRRPGRGRTAGVVHGMDRLEHARAVHPAVGPVKPGIVEREVDEQRKRHPPQRIGLRIGVNPGPAALLPAPHDHACRHAVDRRRGKTPSDLGAHLPAKPGIVAGPNIGGDPRKHPANGKIANGDDHRHHQRG